MQYYGLKSVIASRKVPMALETPAESFFMPNAKITPYIEPTFTKEEYPKEKPTILLISAVGASGKTTTAHALAHEIGLPVLDLAKHKPVADNTLTGILTRAYPIGRVGHVLEGICKGTHGIIIDGIDEGRSKTTEQGFEAFLDDLVELSNGSPVTSIVIFGRSQVLLNTWVYLADCGADVGLVRLDPFDLKQAKGYIDAYVGKRDETQKVMYEQARDDVLAMLGAAFAPYGDGSDAFLSFIGYPPVLDAIATLLRTEPNYHRLSQELSGGDDNNLEVGLLIRIADFLLNRERKEKALPNFIDDIATAADVQVGDELRGSLYDANEQCARVLARALGREFPLQLLEDPNLNDRYEKSVEVWCPEHPFLQDGKVRNAVFEAVALSRCLLSQVSEYREIAVTYSAEHQPTYHLMYILAELAGENQVGPGMINMLIQSCSDFVGKGQRLDIEVSGLSWNESNVPDVSPADFEVQVSMRNGEQERRFSFKGIVRFDDVLSLGPVLVNTSVIVPCGLVLRGHPVLESMGVCQLAAKTVTFESDVVVRQIPQDDESFDSGLFLDVQEALGHADAATLKGGALEIVCEKHSLTYPLAKYVKKREGTPLDPQLKAKFLRLRRILSEFASHSKGGLAKYRDKVEHDRVLQGSLGKRVLNQLLNEGILNLDSKFYYIDSEKLAEVLGITWLELRQHKISKQVESFLKRVK